MGMDGGGGGGGEGCWRGGEQLASARPGLEPEAVLF